MNNKGSVFFGVIIAIFIFATGVLFIPYVADDITSLRTTLNCGDTSANLTNGEMLVCLQASALVPYLIWFFTSIAIGYLVGVTK